MQIAMYKGKGGWFNKLIRFWTKSEYTHCEVIIGGVWYSSSHTDGGVRSRIIRGDSGNWDIYELKGCDKAYALNTFLEVSDCKYDWLGIVLSQAIPFEIHSPKRYFCSELCGYMLDINHPYQFAPHELFNLLKKLGKIGGKTN